MSELLYVWVVRVGKQKCLWFSFSEALEDWRSHDHAWIYPKLMKASEYEKLPEFTGW